MKFMKISSCKNHRPYGIILANSTAYNSVRGDSLTDEMPLNMRMHI